MGAFSASPSQKPLFWCRREYYRVFRTNLCLMKWLSLRNCVFLSPIWYHSEKLKVFLSLRFYVKSILVFWDYERAKSAIPAHLNFDFKWFLHFMKDWIFKINKIQPSWNSKKLTDLELLESQNLFPKNLEWQKIPEFSTLWV